MYGNYCDNDANDDVDGDIKKNAMYCYGNWLDDDAEVSEV